MLGFGRIARSCIPQASSMLRIPSKSFSSACFNTKIKLDNQQTHL